MRPTAFLLALFLLPSAAFALPGVSVTTTELPGQGAQDDTRGVDAVPPIARLEDLFARLNALRPEPKATEALTPKGTVGIQVSGLGDLDGDGHHDLFVSSSHLLKRSSGWQTETRAEAISGKDLQTSLWTLPGTGDVAAIPDVTGDGTPDVARAPQGVSTYEPGTLPSTSFTYGGTYRGEFGLDIYSGRDASTHSSLRRQYTAADDSAVVGAQVVYAGASTDESSWMSQALVAPDRVMEFTETRRAADAYAYAGVGAYQGLRDTDHAYRILGLDGKEWSRLEFTGLGRSGIDARPLQAGPGKTWMAALWQDGVEEQPSSFAPIHAGKMRLTVVDEQGAKLWETTTDTLERGALGRVYPLPDIDGDGAQDLQAILGFSDPAAPSGVRVESQVYSSASGALLHEEVSTQGTVAFLLPFGDVDADGRAELLAVDVPLLLYTWTLRVHALRTDFTEAWTAEVSGLPLNIGGDPFLPSFLDWTGDAIPDLAFRSFDSSGTYLDVLDGSDGSTSWNRSFEDTERLLVLDDVTEKGRQDLAVVRIAGQAYREVDGRYVIDNSNTTVDYSLLAGETGTPVASWPLRGPTLTPVASRGEVGVRSRNVGDVDADGLDEFTIELLEQTDLEWFGSYVESFMRPTVYLLSLKPDEPLVPLPVPMAASTPSPSLPTPSAEPAVAAPSESSSAVATTRDGPAKATPTPAALAMVAMALCALARRGNNPS